jgi:DNA polymerase-3 subunit delta'
MDNLILNSATKQYIEAFVHRPGHALLIEGLAGSGKRSIAEVIITALLGQNTEYLYDYPNENNETISIDTIRDIETHLTLKVPNKQSINRVVLIENAHNMGLEAQNALLKNLEEPPDGTLIILTATPGQSLLPTIYSRTFKILVVTPPLVTTKTYFETKGYSSKDVDKALLTSGGLIGLMSALLQNQDHPLVSATQVARLLLTQSTYERLYNSDGLIKDKILLNDVLSILQQMAHVRLASNDQNVSTWSNILAVSYAAAEQLQHNGQPKLIVDNLLLKLQA